MLAGMSLAVWNLFKDYFFSLFLSHFPLKKFSACLQHNTIIAVYTTIARALQICPSVLWFPFCYMCCRHVFFLFFASSNTCCSSSVKINLKYKSGAACSIISITSCHGHSCYMLQRITTKRLSDMCWQKCKLLTTSLIWWFMRLCFEGGKRDVFRTESILWFWSWENQRYITAEPESCFAPCFWHKQGGGINRVSWAYYIIGCSTHTP
jgi:hypothetical protein